MAERTRPTDVVALGAVFGTSCRGTIGSCVFFEAEADTAKAMEARAVEKYKAFNGAAWEQFGESAWMTGWAPVYTRERVERRAIVEELRSLSDPELKRLASDFLDGIDDPARAAVALGESFDRAEVTELRVFRTGDGGAISGLLIASHRSTGADVFLIYQYD